MKINENDVNLSFCPFLRMALGNQSSMSALQHIGRSASPRGWHFRVVWRKGRISQYQAVVSVPIQLLFHYLPPFFQVVGCCVRCFGFFMWQVGSCPSCWLVSDGVPRFSSAVGSILFWWLKWRVFTTRVNYFEGSLGEQTSHQVQKVNLFWFTGTSGGISFKHGARPTRRAKRQFRAVRGSGCARWRPKMAETPGENCGEHQWWRWRRSENSSCRGLLCKHISFKTSI